MTVASASGQKAAMPERIDLAPGLNVSRIVTGLWQVADIERGRAPLDPDRAAAELKRYAEAGFDSFDMADHYGSAEVITGCFNRLVADGAVTTASGRMPAAFTKWCPTPGPMTAEVVRAAVDRARERMQTERIDLMQLHWWSYEHPAYIDALRALVALKGQGLIGALGLTNFNTDHLRLLVLEGIPIATNQVSFSLFDRRAAEEMTTFCQERGVKLLA
jgi:aryl-alcohol dehydrogenase-like predicted oxidoreductase